MLKRVLFIFILSFLYTFTFTKSYSIENEQLSFKQLTYEHGLPGTNLRDQIQDHYGIMWIAVEAMGICRYDGHKFTHFMHDSENPNTISSNFVNKIIEDCNGNLWIATDHGLNQYIREENRFRVFLNDPKQANSIGSNVCNNLYYNSGNDLWICTVNGFSRLNITDYSFENFMIVGDKKNINQPVSVSSLCEYPKGILWLGTNQGLVKHMLHSGEYKYWLAEGKTDEEPIHGNINDLLPDKYGNLWIATHRGLDRFDLKNEKFKHWKFNEPDKPILEKEGINNLFIDSKGKLWAGSYTNGFLIINLENDTYVRISKESGGEYPLRSNHIKYILEDNVGTFWVGTKFEGLFKLNKTINIFKNWPQRLNALSDLKNKYIFSIFADNDEVCWVGTKLEGLFKVNLTTNEILLYSTDPNDRYSVASNRIQAISRDFMGRLLVGTDRGLQWFDEEQSKFHPIYNSTVNIIYTDSKNQTWVTTIEGIYVLSNDGKSLQRYQSKNNEVSLFQNNLLNINNILEDTDGNLWFSSRNSGLFCYMPQNDSIVYFNSETGNPNKINSDMIRFVFQDSKGIFWIGTKLGGLNRMDPEKGTFKHYLIKDGLPSNLTLCIQEDDKYNLWIGTHNGLSKFNPETEIFENFNSDYGLLSNIAEPYASWKFGQGEMLFGGDAGFNVFYPGDIKKIQSTTPVLITSVKVLDELMVQDIDSSKSLTLKYDQNYLSFEFTLMDFNNPFRHQYEYILEGFDQNWIQNGNRNYTSYTGLPPGNYTFKVRAANELGDWSDSTPSCQIIIKSPVWETLLFRLLTIILLVSLTASVLIYRNRLNKKQQTILENMVHERTIKLEKAYDQLLEKNKLINDQNKLIEQNQAQLEQKVLERTKDLEEAKKRAEEADKLKTSFLANMSHEIRTPLNAICGFSSMLNDEDTTAEMREQYSNIINNNSNLLLKLIEDILDISKIEAGQLKIQKGNFKLNSIFSDIYSIYKEDIRKKGKDNVKLVCPVLNKPDIEIFSDAYRLKQVLVNLLNNALKFTSEGSIEFGFAIESEMLRFYVKDTGIGISEEDRKIIFNRFIKIERRETIYSGTGIGLSISKSIVELLGGKIWVTSEPQKGSLFEFTIPMK
ncbi:MAG: hypothetical protein JW798_15235 [Prolixibacteraceae bacterium]|nr:hypothetical protein [Prolixibacteraceae bacterium]